MMRHIFVSAHGVHFIHSIQFAFARGVLTQAILADEYLMPFQIESCDESDHTTTLSCVAYTTVL